MATVYPKLSDKRLSGRLCAESEIRKCPLENTDTQAVPNRLTQKRPRVEYPGCSCFRTKRAVETQSCVAS